MRGAHSIIDTLMNALFVLSRGMWRCAHSARAARLFFARIAALSNARRRGALARVS